MDLEKREKYCCDIRVCFCRVGACNKRQTRATQPNIFGVQIRHDEIEKEIVNFFANVWSGETVLGLGIAAG